MTRIACTGHRGLPGPTQRLIDTAIRDHLSHHTPGLVGLSCLADGADQIFARAVLGTGGKLEVIVPARRYRDELPAAAHAEYDTLLAQAAAVHPFPFTDSTAEAHMRASVRMLDLADELLAVWDGKRTPGYGGTADVIDAARKRQMTVHVLGHPAPPETAEPCPSLGGTRSWTSVWGVGLQYDAGVDDRTFRRDFFRQLNDAALKPDDPRYVRIYDDERISADDPVPPVEAALNARGRHGVVRDLV